MKRALIPLILLSPLTILLGAKLNPAHISADSKWMLHMDLDAFRNSQTGQNARSKWMGDEVEKKLQEMKETYGIDLDKGMHGATLYGNGEKDNGVLVIHADMDKQKLINFAKRNKEYGKSSYNGHKIHSLPGKRPGKQAHVCFHGKGTIIVAQTKELIEGALDVLDGQTPSIKVGEGMRSLSEELENPMMIAYGDFSALKEIQDNPKAAMLKMASRSGFAVGESLGISKASMFLEAKDADSCQQIESIIRGILALGSLQRDKQPDVAKLTNAFIVERNDNLLKVSFRMDTQELIAIGDNMREQRKGSKHRWHEKRKKLKESRE